MVGRRAFIALAATGVVAVGVAAGVALLPTEERRIGPPTLRYGADRCAYCGMLISDARFAAAWRDVAGKDQRFDDIGCMVNAARQHDPGAGTAWFVHDYRDESWLDAAAATYVLSDAIKTPMAYKLAAVSTSDAAAVLIRGGGTASAWDAVRQSLERKG